MLAVTIAPADQALILAVRGPEPDVDSDKSRPVDWFPACGKSLPTFDDSSLIRLPG
jgi:hypothetical protein